MNATQQAYACEELIECQPPKPPPENDLPVTGMEAGIMFAAGAALVALSALLRRYRPSRST